MAKNEFKPFATGSGANVTTQTDWESLPVLSAGFTSGKASSAQWICPYISRHLLSLNPLLACCRRYSRGER
ncbi:hypothetical protein EI007_05465 [Escherichia coli]|nr:hypothetical protein [Escherichia coli]